MNAATPGSEGNKDADAAALGAVRGKDSGAKKDSGFHAFIIVCKDFLTALAILTGGAWGACTWCRQWDRQDQQWNRQIQQWDQQDQQWVRQNQQHIASLAPALEVRICAHQKVLQNKESFLGKDVDTARKYLEIHKNTRFIEGSVFIKNVGTLKTNLQVCECVETKEIKTYDPPGNLVQVDQRDIFVKPCEILQSKDLGQAIMPSCHDNDVANLVAKGPIVISRVYLDQNGMRFAPMGRFWLTRPPVDRHSEIESTDEIRPNAEDKFEFLVPVEGPGIYAVMFTSPIDKIEFQHLKDEDPKYASLPWWPRWDATTFLEVSESMPKSGQNPVPSDCDQPLTR